MFKKNKKQKKTHILFILGAFLSNYYLLHVITQLILIGNALVLFITVFQKNLSGLISTISNIQRHNSMTINQHPYVLENATSEYSDISRTIAICNGRLLLQYLSGWDISSCWCRTKTANVEVHKLLILQC